MSRLCAICRKKRPGEKTYNFTGTLRTMNIAGTHAHIACMQDEDKRRKRIERKTGVKQ